jgi:hypothetical protein
VINIGGPALVHFHQRFLVARVLAVLTFSLLVPDAWKNRKDKSYVAKNIRLLNSL